MGRHWSEAEVFTLFTLFQQYQTAWELYERHFRGRTAAQIKAKYHSDRWRFKTAVSKALAAHPALGELSQQPGGVGGCGEVGGVGGADGVGNVRGAGCAGGAESADGAEPIAPAEPAKCGMQAARTAQNERDLQSRQDEQDGQDERGELGELEWQYQRNQQSRQRQRSWQGQRSERSKQNEHGEHNQQNQHNYHNQHAYHNSWNQQSGPAAQEPPAPQTACARRNWNNRQAEPEIWKHPALLAAQAWRGSQYSQDWRDQRGYGAESDRQAQRVQGAQQDLQDWQDQQAQQAQQTQQVQYDQQHQQHQQSWQSERDQLTQLNQPDSQDWRESAAQQDTQASCQNDGWDAVQSAEFGSIQSGSGCQARPERLQENSGRRELIYYDNATEPRYPPEILSHCRVPASASVQQQQQEQEQESALSGIDGLCGLSSCGSDAGSGQEAEKWVTLNNNNILDGLDDIDCIRNAAISVDMSLAGDQEGFQGQPTLQNSARLRNAYNMRQLFGDEIFEGLEGQQDCQDQRSRREIQPQSPKNCRNRLNSQDPSGTQRRESQRGQRDQKSPQSSQQLQDRKNKQRLQAAVDQKLFSSQQSADGYQAAAGSHPLGQQLLTNQQLEIPDCGQFLASHQVSARQPRQNARSARMPQYSSAALQALIIQGCSARLKHGGKRQKKVDFYPSQPIFPPAVLTDADIAMLTELVR